MGNASSTDWNEKEYLPQRYTRYTTKKGKIVLKQPDDSNESRPNFSVELIE
jgi:hypothetical protein